MHTDMSVSDVGLTIHPDFPHYGASPDGDCCGGGVIEVKCPFACRERSFLKASEDSPTFCLVSYGDGKFKLKRKHAYFYQFQLQMKICKVEYGDFVIWRENELIVLRIEKDETFLEEAMDKADNFFKYGILPQLLANWYTKATKLQSSSQVPEQAECVKASNTTLIAKKYCYCQDKKEG